MIFRWHRWFWDAVLAGVAFAVALWANEKGWLASDLASHVPVLAGVFATLFGLGAAAYVFAVMLPSADFAGYLAGKHVSCNCHTALENLRFVFQWQTGCSIVGLGLTLAVLGLDAPAGWELDLGPLATALLVAALACTVKAASDVVTTLSSLGKVWEAWLIKRNGPP